MTTKTATLSLASIEAQVSNETPTEFEPNLPNGDPSGVILLVLSEQAPSVAKKLAALSNEARRKAAISAAKADKARPGEAFTPVEDDILFVRRLTIARLAGWKGLEEEFNEANALKLMELAPGFGSQIIAQSADLAGFTNASPKT